MYVCVPLVVVSLIHESVGPTCAYTLPVLGRGGMSSGDLDAAEIGYVVPKWDGSLTYRR